MAIPFTRMGIIRENTMHIHILGICGTFMAGIAVLAKQQGHHVTGSDAHVYPPMSTQLREQGIEIREGYEPSHLIPTPDCIIVGNAMKRGMPVIEYLLEHQLPYTSGPQWLYENILQTRWVLAVAGTHGKTTTASMLAWILEQAGLKPGFLIGGIPQNFGLSARLGSEPFFVMEADEYDTAFFDKRSKFIHYHPRTVILNNLEFDHADIFPDLAAIKTQFHHLVRIIPGNGLIICPADDQNLQDVLTLGCWTPVESIGAAWSADPIKSDGSEFTVSCENHIQGQIQWSLLGQHNMHNALAAIAAARHAGVPAHHAIAALSKFKNVKRRLEIRGEFQGITVYDDFAHHPTAIATTLAGLRQRVGSERIIAVLELGSYTMRTGVHRDAIIPALKEADIVLLAKPSGEDWGVAAIAAALKSPAQVFPTVEKMIAEIIENTRASDHILIMSNTGFDGLHEKLLQALSNR